jgi:enoyl-CoA hydratase/carnithine racemase
MPNQVRIEIADGVATVTLCDPERRNALNLDMCDEIVAAFDDASCASAAHRCPRWPRSTVRRWERA